MRRVTPFRDLVGFKPEPDEAVALVGVVGGSAMICLGIVLGGPSFWFAG